MTPEIPQPDNRRLVTAENLLQKPAWMKKDEEWTRRWNLAFGGEERQEQLKDLAARHSVDNIQERQGKQSKKTPVEAQAIWKELVHEERLNKRLGKGRELISVLSQILDKKTSPAAVEGYAMRAEEAARRAETSAKEAKDSANSANEASTRAETAETNTERFKIEAETSANKANTALQATTTAIANEGARRRRFWVRFREQWPGVAVAGILGTIAIIIALNTGGDGRTDQAVATPTPSSAAGEPTPSPTVEPTEVPTPEPTPVLASTPKPTETPNPTEIPTAAPKVENVQLTPSEAHAKRLIELDSIFREEGIEAWLKAAGFTYTSLELSARQPEETLFGNKIVATGFQVKATGLNANWPIGLTTDQPVNANCVKPDPNNLSKVCTNVRDFTGNATLYVDLQDWKQLAPK